MGCPDTGPDGDPEEPDLGTGEPVARLDDPGSSPVVDPWPLLALGDGEPLPGLAADGERAGMMHGGCSMDRAAPAVPGRTPPGWRAREVLTAAGPNDNTAVLARKPSGMGRLWFRLPASLHRAGLGRLLGHRFLVLEHRGRRSGRLYRTLLEVVDYDAARREATVISAWGEDADWYRNLRTGPPVAVRIAGDRYPPETRFLDGAERLELLRRFRRRHPIEARLARPILGWKLDGSEAELTALAARLRAVAFRPPGG